MTNNINHPTNNTTPPTSLPTRNTVGLQNATQSSATNSPTDASSSSNNTNACAACRFQRRKCAENCPLAPYFPAHNHQQFINAYKIFGVGKIVKALNSVAPNFRDDAMTALIYSANARAQYPVGGCKHIIDALRAQIAIYNDQLSAILTQIAAFRAAVSTGGPPPFISCQVQVAEALPLLSPARFRELDVNLQEDVKPILDLRNEGAETASKLKPENADNQVENVALLEHKLEDNSENIEPRIDEQKSTKRKSEDQFGKHKNKRIKHSSFDALDNIPCYDTFYYPL